MSRKRLGILLSGRGSNFEAIADNIAAGNLDAEIAIVISNRPEARGLEIARERGLPALCMPSKGLEREEYDQQLALELKRRCRGPGVSGWIHAAAERPRSFASSLRVVNIHPSLLPAFPGLDAQDQAVDHGAKISGCTVHFVDERLDAGPIILQAAVPVRSDDTVETLAARILAEEHRIYSEAIGIVLHSRWRIEGRRVIVES